jgi:predicted ATPase
MKITSIKVKGYKNLLDCTYNMGDFNVLIGANNSGKSNLLEIFSFLDDLISGSDDIKENIFKGYSSRGRITSDCTLLEESNISLELEFQHDIGEDSFKYIYYLEIKPDELFNDDNGYIVREFLRYKNIKKTGSMITVFERSNTIVDVLKGSKISKIDSTQSLLSLIHKISDIKESLNPAAQTGISDVFVIAKTPVIYSSANEIRDTLSFDKKDSKSVIKKGRIATIDLVSQIEQILKSDKKQYFEEMLSDILKLSIKMNTIGQFIKYITVKYIKDDSSLSDYESNIDQLSDGTLIVLNLLTCLVSNKYPVLAIEELENCIHPKLLRELIEIINRDFSHIQLIITTHSPVLLNMVKLENVSYILNQNCEGAKIESVKNRKDLVKELTGPFSNFSDIFDLLEAENEGEF